MEKLRRFALFVQVLCGVVLFLGRVALGQTSKKDPYAAAVNLGTDAANIDDIRGAIAGWKQADAIEPKWWLACAIGRLSIRIEELPQAAKYLNRCVRTAPPPKSEEWIKRRGEELLELETIKLQLVTVDIKADDGAEIFANGELEDVAPCKYPLFFTPGQIWVKAKIGFKIEERFTAGERGEKRTIDLSTPIEVPTITVNLFPLASLEPAPTKPLPMLAPSTPSTWQSIRAKLPLVGGVGGLAAAMCAVSFLPLAKNSLDAMQANINDGARARLAGDKQLAARHLEDAESARVEGVILSGVGIGCAAVSAVLLPAAGISAALDSAWLSPRSAGIQGRFTW